MARKDGDTRLYKGIERQVGRIGAPGVDIDDRYFVLHRRRIRGEGKKKEACLSPGVASYIGWAMLGKADRSAQGEVLDFLEVSPEAFVQAAVSGAFAA